ncbi:glycoside hydrolase family 26 protein [Flagellimonas crocea]|uniref:glycoside hydrolase family 26 protein n=1 Tax=Flagellimonas crocea TaxID=3067311 RepID=UPI00296E9ECB|nr:glycosyl hydrolase [Muricauda sp. DH64]
MKNMCSGSNKAFCGLLGFFVVVMQSCSSYKKFVDQNTSLTDKTPTLGIKLLYHKVNNIKKEGYAFGHQDALAYGIGWKNNGNIFKSDVHEVTGDHPAVYGFEIGHIEKGRVQNLDTVNFDLMKSLIRKANHEKGIVTISWHPDNPVSQKSAWDTTEAVKHVLKDGPLHPKYRGWLSQVADFLNDLKDKKGNLIPVIFRPYHEMNGDWFWWGEGNCTSEEYRQLWRETVDILSNEFDVHNVLYAYSVNTFRTTEEYLKYYPGDSYVDILGVDIYQHGTVEDFVEALNTDLAILKKIANDKNKPLALTEAGLNKVPIEDWWTRILDKNIAPYDISWALFWRNAWPSHYFVPYTGATSSSDFVKFKELPHVLFLKDIKKIK